MSYSIEPKNRIFVKSCGTFYFTKNMSKNIGKNISKNVSSKYKQKLLDHDKQSVTDTQNCFKMTNSKNS